MNLKHTNHQYLLIIFLALIFFGLSSCSKTESIEVEYSFESAINVKQGIKTYDQIKFEPFEDLDLGFFKGNAWVKLEITNNDDHSSYMVMMNDLINRNYRFYKLDTLSNEIKPASYFKDVTKYDHRTFNDAKPNFEIRLKPNEKAIYYFSTESDGRILQATPRLLKIEDYRSIISTTSIFNILFFAAIGMLLLINVFHWTILKKRIYYFYGFYILSSCLFYLNVEGFFYGLGVPHSIIDHFLFVCIRLWIFSTILFTSQFLELNHASPKIYRFIKWLLLIILGGTTLYQFIFFNSSISNLHIVENLFGFIWIVIAIVMIRFSIQKRRMQARYYLIAFSFLIAFVLLGLIDSHTTLLPGDPFSYFKIGTIIEFIGFTYFIVLIIKKKISRTISLENEFIQNKKDLSIVTKQLESKIDSKKDKTDLLGIFKLIENSLSTEAEWAEFKSKFKEINPSFLEQLFVNHPDLTKSEIRLLILIKIGYSQKEIANILNIAPESVKKAKNRVRKRLNLTKNITLNEYLLQL